MTDPDMTRTDWANDADTNGGMDELLQDNELLRAANNKAGRAILEKALSIMAYGCTGGDVTEDLAAMLDDDLNLDRLKAQKQEYLANPDPEYWS